MGPPASKVRRSGRNEPGVSILERVPILGRCSRSSPIQEFAALARSSVAGSGRKPPTPSAPVAEFDSVSGVRGRRRERLRLWRKQQHENAPVSASAASAVTLLPQHRAPTRWDDPLRLSPRQLPREIPLLWVSPQPRPLVCDPDQALLPWSIDAPNTRGPSANDRAANPSASNTRLG
jgi:hypothetical protein